MPHTLNRANQPILQFITIRGENSVACSESRSSQSLRLGKRSALAQVAGSRLGETTTKAMGDFSSARLGEAIGNIPVGYYLR